MKRRMAVAVAALAAGMGMTVAAGVAAPVTAMASTPAVWNRIFQSRESGTFTNVAAVSKSDVWASGFHVNANGQLTGPAVHPALQRDHLEVGHDARRQNDRERGSGHVG